MSHFYPGRIMLSLIKAQGTMVDRTLGTVVTLHCPFELPKEAHLENGPNDWAVLENKN